jgi:hypothetical protein
VKTWAIGNTTVRNPRRIGEALRLFAISMGGRPFNGEAQRAFQDLMIAEGLVAARPDAADKQDYASGARKFASCFKQLGLVTDWAKGREWILTSVGRTLLTHPELEETLFLRQMLKYQLPSPLEREQGLHLRPFRLLLRFLVRAQDEDLIGLTKDELGLFVITTLTEDAETFEAAWQGVRALRAAVEMRTGLMARRREAATQLELLATRLGLMPGTLTDYADSNGRYGLMSGLLTTHGARLSVLTARRPFVDALLADDLGLIIGEAYLDGWLYDAEQPRLPSDDIVFLVSESRALAADVTALAVSAGEMEEVAPPSDWSLTALQAYERRLRARRMVLREAAYARDHHLGNTIGRLGEIREVLERVIDRNSSLIGGQAYKPALLEWAVWRLFLVIDHLIGAISQSRNFPLDEDLNPIHHAPGGAGDLVLTFSDYTLVVELTLLTGSRQFAAEGEPVTRHVYREMTKQPGSDRPVYGLFIAPVIDPNTADLYHQARYWANDQNAVPTPVVSLTVEDILYLIDRLMTVIITPDDLQQLIKDALALQTQHADGPSWQRSVRLAFRGWLEGLLVRR